MSSVPKMADKLNLSLANGILVNKTTCLFKPIHDEYQAAEIRNLQGYKCPIEYAHIS